MKWTWTILLTCSLFYKIDAGSGWFQFGNGQALPKAMDSGVSIALPFDLILFKKNITKGTKLWISTNGYITIGKELKKFPKDKFPLSDPAEDPLSIVPFKARMQYRPDEVLDKEASVTYSTAPRGHILSQIDSTIQGSVSKARTDGYASKDILVVSWNKISFFSGNPEYTPYPRNSFQVVISTDGVSTYAVFNYRNIVWDGGLASGGRASTGTGADAPRAQAGVNAGNGKGFTDLAYGNSILDIDIEQASETAGQYVYELSGSSPKPHGCVNHRPASMPLSLSPSSGPMTGGNAVEISDACFSRFKTIHCKFGDQMVKGEFLRPSKARCYAPIFYANKELKFRLLIDGLEVYARETFYLTSVFKPNLLNLLDLDNWAAVKPNGKLEMNWDPKELSHYRGPLRVKLFTYQESGASYGWQEEMTIEEGVGNSGHYKVDHSKLHCKEKCKEKTVGAIVLELANSPDKNSPGRLWSRPMALGWYVNKKLENSIGKAWPAQMCFDWFTKDSREGLGWLNELEDCPCSKEQAIGDIGRFVPDPGCNMYNKGDPANCYYHQMAEHCVRSIWPSYPTGSGAQCCYDTLGNLLYAGDSIYGSTVDKSHSMGTSPYNAPGYVPSFSHWLSDVITYQYCCLWSSISFTCGMYMDQRPTKDCKLYKSAKTAAIYGESNVLTLNKKTIRHTQAGAHTLLKSNKDAGAINIQGMFSNIAGIARPLLTGIALQSEECSTVEITLNSMNTHEEKTTVMVDGMLRDFTQISWSRQEFKGVQMWTDGKTDQSNFTIALVHGIGLVVTATQQSLNLIITVPRPLMSSIKRKSLLTGLESPALALVGPYDSMFTRIITDYSKAKKDVSAVAQQIAQYARILDGFNQPVISCGMPVTHGTRKGHIYTAGAKTQISSCRVGYRLSETSARIHTCSSSGVWTPKITNKCQYVGFPIFDPPTTTTTSTTTPTTTTTSTTTTKPTTSVPTTSVPTTSVPTTSIPTSTTTTPTTTKKKLPPKSTASPATAPTTVATSSRKEAATKLPLAKEPYINITALERTVPDYTEYEELRFNETGNGTDYDLDYAEAPLDVDIVDPVAVQWIPNLTEDGAAFPLTILFSSIFIFVLVLLGIIHRHRKRELQKRLMTVETKTESTKHKMDNELSSVESIRVEPPVAEVHSEAPETLNLPYTVGTKSYRVAVDQPPPNYSPLESEEESDATESHHSSEPEDEDLTSRLKSYRVAVDPPPPKRSYPITPSRRYQLSKNNGLTPAGAVGESNEEEASRLTSYRVAVDPPRRAAGRSGPSHDALVEESEF